MKKLFALCMVLLFVGAAGASAQVYNWEDVFTIEFPDEWETVVDDSENTEDYQNLVTAFDADLADGINVTVEMNSFADRQGEFLSKMSDQEIDAYVKRLLAEHAAEQAVYLDRFESKADALPFVVITGSTEFGPYYQAETCIDGMVISFYGYAYPDETYADSQNRPWTDADMKQFQAIVESFTVL